MIDGQAFIINRNGVNDVNLRKRLEPFIGDKAFYRTVFALLLPVVLQNALTNFVSLLDNVMIGRVGTDQMNGVSIVNQLIFVFNLCIFGGLAGAGIFTAQFFGKKDHDGVRSTFRFKLITCVLLFIVGTAVFLSMHQPLIGSYLHEGSMTGDIAATALYAKDYLMVMLWGLLPYAVGQVYASTLRETGETVVPMKAGIIAIFVNLVFNYLLIFGRLGFPQLGVEGAAIATVLSRYIECGIIVCWTHMHKQEHPFIRGAYRTLRVPASLTAQMLKKGLPLLINEFLWSSAMAMLTQCYSTRGLAVVAGLNICTTIANLFNAVWLSMGTVVAIMVGQQLGASEFDRAKQTVRRLLAISVSGAAVLALIMCLFAPIFPLMYNTTSEVRSLAARLLIIVALSGPLHAFCHACYFTLRSGGKTLITFLFDSAYMWAVSIPLAWILSNRTSLPILPIYAICQYIDITKCFIGAFLLKKGVWINNIVNAE